MTGKIGILGAAVFIVLVTAAIANGMLNQGYVAPQPSQPIIGISGSVIQAPAQGNNNGNILVPDTGERRVVKLGYSNYAFFFPESGSDTITLKAGQPVRLEAMLEGENKLVGCMKSIRTQWGTKVFRPGDITFDFTPEQAGTIPFTCGMGMGAGVFQVTN